MSDVDGEDAPDAELAGIVIRAGELGLSASRVATALGISPAGFATIQHQLDASSRVGAAVRRPDHS